MRAVAFAQLVMLFVCIFLYRFGPPTPLLHSRNCASLWKHLLKSGRKPKKGWERNLFLFSSLFEKQKSTTPFLSSLSRVTCIISFSIQYPPIILDLLSLSLSLRSSRIGFCYKMIAVFESEQVDSVGAIWRKKIRLTQNSWSKMALETLSSSELFNFIIYDTISATPYDNHENSFLLENGMTTPQDHQGSPLKNSSSMTRKRHPGSSESVERKQNLGVQERKKRRRKPRVSKNKEEAETQRMTHIAVERNRRKQMNEHLAVLRSLMPESYVQRVCFLSTHISLSHFRCEISV